MIILDGVKYLTTEDIFKNSFKPSNLFTIMNKLKYETIDDLINEYAIVRDTAETMFCNSSVKLIMVPVSIVDQYIICKNLSMLTENIDNQSISGGYDNYKSLMNDEFLKLENLNMNIKLNKKQFTIPNVCVLADIDKKEIIDFCVGVPSTILERMNRHLTYSCCKCGKSVVCDDELFPENFYYEPANNNEGVLYYCKQCAENSNVKVHVGAKSEYK